MNFSAANSFHYGLPAADSWQHVSSGGTEMDREVGSDAAFSIQPAATFPWKLRMAGTYPVSVWPGCCLAHDLSHTHTHRHRHTHVHRHTMCAQKLALYQAAGIYLCDELILSDCVDPASVTLSRSLWNPLNFAANQLWKHTQTQTSNEHDKYFPFRNHWKHLQQFWKNAAVDVSAVFIG